MAVVTYWRFPDEEDKFLTYLEKTDGIVACIDEWVADTQEVKPLPIRELIEVTNPEDLLFGPREFMDMTPIVSMEQEGRTVFGRHYSSGPLISYSRGSFRSARSLGRTNLVFNSYRGIPDESNPGELDFVPQPPEFMAWGRRVLGWMRRNTQPHGYYRVTARVAAEVENGLELVF